MRPLYQETMSEYEQVKRVIQDSLANVNTMMPCKITGVNYPKVTVQPLINRIFINSNKITEYLPYGEFSDIPVLTLGNSDFHVELPPPVVGDIGLLITSQNQISHVYDRNEKETPRKFSITDSVFIPFFMKTSSSSSNKVIVKTEKFNVTNETDELLASILQALNAIKTLTTTDGATINPASQAAIQLAITKIQGFT